MARDVTFYDAHCRSPNQRADLSTFALDPAYGACTLDTPQHSIPAQAISTCYKFYLYPIKTRSQVE
jgi:hypothetical protein